MNQIIGPRIYSDGTIIGESFNLGGVVYRFRNG